MFLHILLAFAWGILVFGLLFNIVGYIEIQKSWITKGTYDPLNDLNMVMIADIIFLIGYYTY